MFFLISHARRVRHRSDPDPDPDIDRGDRRKSADALIENLGYLASNAELEAARLSACGNRAAAELQTRRANIYRDAQAEAMR
jgi:hypothetical protein